MADQTESKAAITDDDIIRLLQIGYVLEGIVEARSDRHTTNEVFDRTITRRLLADARDESRQHRRQIGALLESLGAECSSSQQIEKRIKSHYCPAEIDDRCDILQDQFYSELSAYRFYDAVLNEIQANATALSIDIDNVVTVLEEIRAEELEGVFEVMNAANSADGACSDIEIPKEKLV
ncbi:hypothetical protein RBH26_18830 [Natronolimnohabitans sp. A-GB9]|uniref:hypothetical protein n=1 Tax=Natronolimnohabitans sp. A-GB9 TaxID=3069757 RepID=UPI0027B563B7|nr:hypothetical protein [Natronolimnohabitans sp. A-GB9]MDQ2052521.1 hypothetical protein [Natronolimnohabitans sp. A-GB9]